MKIKKQNSQILELENSNKFYLGRLLLFLFAIPFFLLGIWIILSFGKLHILQCDRELTVYNVIQTQQISCQLTRQGLMGKEIIKINQLQGAKLNRNKDNPNEITYRVDILTDHQIIPLAEVYSSGRQGKTDKVTKINIFVKNPAQNSLIVKQDNQFFAYFIAGFFALIGGGLMILSITFFRQVSCIFDKVKGVVFIRQDNIFTSKIIEYQLGQIKRVKIVEQKDSKDNQIFKPKIPKIILHQGLEISLDLTGSISEQEMMIKSINNFLQLTDLNKN
ncbi:hypothetical protein [Geminocystis sp. GBBB08]|uniref:hypothetical protein n=1 Tax=Geminocystis sp. GBBB08 TaxID=2604140 RepID=UPI0027E3AC09|nr:hypothetical protein [Geminocystis sp. GBBB08]MBL1208665.1 hypothetical protein [Geminocystis sp. GBBB08]